MNTINSTSKACENSTQLESKNNIVMLCNNVHHGKIDDKIDGYIPCPSLISTTKKYSEFINHNINNERLDILTSVAGSDKYKYLTKEIIKAISENKSILILLKEATEAELSNKLITYLYDDKVFKKIIGEKVNDNRKLKYIIDFLNEAKITILNSNLIEDNLLKKKMIELSYGKNGLDLVFIDHLQTSIASSNGCYFKFDNKLKELENIANDLNCKIIATIQLDARYA